MQNDNYNPQFSNTVAEFRPRVDENNFGHSRVGSLGPIKGGNLFQKSKKGFNEEVSNYSYAPKSKIQYQNKAATTKRSITNQKLNFRAGTNVEPHLPEVRSNAS
jgi:hypothetical protein